MPRAPRDSRIETQNARRKLSAQAEPYWRNIGEGLFIGYRRTKRGSAWICRRRIAGRYVEQRIGTPDDFLAPDGVVVFSYHEAVELARGVAKEIAAPAPRHYGDGLTINDCWTTYRKDYLRNLPALKVSESYWGQHVEDSLGKKLVAATKAEDYRTWLRELASKPPKTRTRNFDPADPEYRAGRAASANRVWTIVKAALNHCLAAELLPVGFTPWRDVPPLKVADADERPPRMLDRGEITSLLNACVPDLRQLVTGALMTGARYGELCAMRVRQFDRETSRLAIRQSKSGKVLYQPLTDEGTKFFTQLTKDRAAVESMFLRTTGEAWGVGHQHRPVRQAAQEAKLDGVSFKVTRATYGKLLLLATRDIELVAKALGHSDSRITRKHYAAYLPNEVAEGVAMMPALGIDTQGEDLEASPDHQ